MPDQDKKPVEFEAALEELEALVTRIMDNEEVITAELPLEEALKQFERGIQLTRDCQKALREAEQKVDLLMEKAGDADAAPFEPES